MNNWFASIREELERARQLYPPHRDHHEAYNRIQEQLLEYFEQTQKPSEQHDVAAIRKQLHRIAANCVRALQELTVTAPP